ncbi:interleukin-1 receptor type 1 isoform X1 [Colossoma macropomum]|uniref:interleukin-1 receptor type 1 isoform X1 n=2 Tax=Colossoma macropomum TaxID=42526 RepID=UPI0018644A1A|nr:interleukin-1 receptor type 1 isoform X1 [Colossoma macropomum]XP_036417749.1 interleukin-1 receptor type 1 isoform X1 [Colossoma macropomum]XP_036417750.1 interleukin-1 receptor type 1 isoform X1 [Colossoma macropomum]XP_036417751.1 interleukin-1 receptor type 1 isoform X1 [Colossoma macropomum]
MTSTLNENMGMRSLTLLALVWTIAGLDLCKDYGEAFERVFTVPHEAALLNCSLVNEYVFEFLDTPYNITWYNQRTGLEVTGEEDGTIVKGTKLWFLNSTVEHQGKYLCVVRTPDKCYKQATVLLVEQPKSGECGRPQKAPQWLQASVNDNLACPLRDYTEGVESFSIQWYKGCELLQEGPKFIFLDNKLVLLVLDVSPKDSGFYTCRMMFVLGGVTSEVAETIECEVTDAVSLRPRMIEPSKENITLALGSPFEKQCCVFIPGTDVHMVMLEWVYNQNPSDRVYQTPTNESHVAEGVWLERTLKFSSVLPEDLNVFFNCVAYSSRGNVDSYFKLQPADPDLRLPIGLLLTMLALLFMMGVFLYSMFKVELALAFRTHCPFLYESTDGDGKLYDAYVVYPRFHEDTSKELLEMFAVKTLPQVLEGCYGYRLFILGRDSIPGQAVVDVVEDTLSRCRRLLLLYTNLSLCRPEGVEWVERQMGLHRALVEGSLKVALLEMSEVSDPSSLPESVRLLREKQGAVQAWDKRRRWKCWPTWSGQRGMEKDSSTEKPLAFFNLPPRFWREVRYHMPVRGKAKPHSKRNVLLNL